MSAAGRALLEHRHINTSHDEVVQPIGGARLHHLWISNRSASSGMARTTEEAQSQARPRVGKQSRAAARL